MCSASAADLSAPWLGTWKKGMPKLRTSSATFVWLEITMGIVIGSSPRRWRHRMSNRQWSEVEAKIATRFGCDMSRRVHSRLNSDSLASSASSTSGRRTAKSSRWKTVRWKNAPPTGSSVYWSREPMLAPSPASVDAIAETMPGWSRPWTMSEAVSTGRLAGRDDTADARGWLIKSPGLCSRNLVLEVLDPLPRGLEATEGVEVQAHLAVLRLEACGDVADEAVRPGGSQQVGDRESVARGDAGRGRNPHALGVRQEPANAGR